MHSSMRRAERLDAMASRSLPSARSRLQGFSGFRMALVLLVSGYAMTLTFAQQPAVPPPAPDAVTNAQLPSPAEEVRPEQRKSDHDRSTVFNPQQADPASPVFEKQPKQGKICASNDSSRTSLATARSSRSPCAASRRVLRTFTMAAC